MKKKRPTGKKKRTTAQRTSKRSGTRRPASKRPARKRSAGNLPIGPPHRAYRCEIVSPLPVDNPIPVEMGDIEVTIEADGPTPVDSAFGVGALSYLSGTAAPTPGGGFAEVTPGVYRGSISAPCRPTEPYEKFRICALAYFLNPSGNPMDPPVTAEDDKGVYQGRCVDRRRRGRER